MAEFGYTFAGKTQNLEVRCRVSTWKKGTPKLLLQWLAIFVVAKLKSRKFKPLLFLCIATAWTLSWGVLVLLVLFEMLSIICWLFSTSPETNTTPRRDCHPLRSAREMGENVAFSLVWKTTVSVLLTTFPFVQFWTAFHLLNGTERNGQSFYDFSDFKHTIDLYNVNWIRCL